MQRKAEIEAEYDRRVADNEDDESMCNHCIVFVTSNYYP